MDSKNNENEFLKENNKKILEVLKLRSLKTQINNKAIFLSKIDTVTLDLYELLKFSDNKNSKLVNDVLTIYLENIDFELLKKKRNKTSEEEEIYKKLKAITNQKDLLKAISVENSKREKEYKKFKRIVKLNNRRIKEDGDNKLYLATYFIETDIADVQVRAPLIFFAINVKFNDRERKITLKIDGKPLHNFALLSLISSKNNKALNSFIFEKYLSSNSKNPNDILAELKETYKTLGLFINKAELMKWMKASDINKFEVKQKNTASTKEIKIFKKAVIGMFSLNEGFVFNDLNQILNNTKWINSILSISGTMDRTFNVNNYSQNFSEDKLLLFNDIDLYQQNAIKMALDINPVVIQGPPGTGKTQTIINLILNLIDKNKRVLVVSEKQTALDVIYERLNFPKYNMQSFAFNLSLKNDKKKFFNQFMLLDKLLESQKQNSVDKKNYLNYDDYLSKVSLINNIKNIKLEDTDYVLNDLYEFALNYKNDLFYKFPIQDIEWVKNNFDDLFDKNWLLRFERYNEWEKNLKFDLKGKDFVWLINLKPKKLKDVVASYMVTDSWNEDLRNAKKLKKINFANISEYLVDQMKIYKRDFHSFDINKYNQDQKDAMIFILENEFIKAKDKTKLLDYLNKLQLIQKYEQVIEDFSSDIRDLSNNPLKIKTLKHKVIKNNLKYLFENKVKEFINNYFKNQKGVNSLIKMSVNSKNKSPVLWVKKNLEVLSKIYPITIATCEDVSEFLELVRNQYDYVIFDEASQIFFEKALPSIYRAKNVVVLGDKKQLRPSNFFESRNDLDDVESEYMDYDDDYLDLIESESILDFYEKNIKQKVMLKGHYRSKYNELIEFSNKNFYNGQLWFENEASPITKPAIEVYDVRGKWNNSVNIKEAQKVAQIVKRFASKNKNTLKSIGVITFNAKQRDLIEEEILKLNDFYVNQLLELKNEKGEDISLFVKSIEDVQGDERDYIIFSIGYSSDVHNYGPISREGGENRINVAITRAIEKIIIVKSHPARKYYGLTSSMQGPKTFIKYLMYAEEVANERYNNDEDHLEDETFNTYIEDIKESIDKVIKSEPSLKKKFKVEKHKGAKTKLSMDLIIYKENIPFVTIIANEEEVNNNFEMREKFIFKQEFLENRGWKVHRLNKYVWSYDKELQLKIIKNLLLK